MDTKEKATELPRSKTRPEAKDLLFAFLPTAAIAAALLLPPDPYRTTIRHWILSNWGNIASLWGLGLSIYVLWVAKGARAAAQEATAQAEQAAAEARSAVRVREVLNDLQQCADRNTQIRLSAAAQDWALVKLRAEEVMITCRTTVERWANDETLTEHKTELLNVATQMESIIKEAGKSNASVTRIETAQISVSKKLSTILGAVLRRQDSGSR